MPKQENNQFAHLDAQSEFSRLAQVESNEQQAYVPSDYHGNADFARLMAKR